MGWLDEIEKQEARARKARRVRIEAFAREIDAMVRSDLAEVARKSFNDRYTISGPRTDDLLEGDIEWIAESIDKRPRIGEGVTSRWVRVSLEFDRVGAATGVYVSTSGVVMQPNPSWGRYGKLDGTFDQQALRDALLHMYRTQPPR